MKEAGLSNTTVMSFNVTYSLIDKTKFDDHDFLSLVYEIEALADSRMAVLLFLE